MMTENNHVMITVAKARDVKKVQALNLQLFEKERKDFDVSLDLEWTFGKVATTYFHDRITKDDGCVLLAMIGDEIVGYLCGGLTKKASYRIMPSVAVLENMFVLEKYRSQGVGKKLHDTFVAWCKTKNVGKIRVVAFVQNERAIQFYKKNGFHEYSVILESDI